MPARVRFLLLALLIVCGAAVAQNVAANREVVGEHLNGLDARELFPFREWSHEFVVVEGKDRGETRTVTFSPDPAIAGGWILESDDNRAFIKRNAQDDVVLYQIDVPQHDRSARIDPPLLLLPATLKPEEVYPSEGRVLVYHLNGDRKPEEGRYSSKIHRISQQTFFTRAGRMQGLLLAFEVIVDMTLIDLDVRFEYGISPEVGLLYRQNEWTIEAIKLFDRSGVRAILLKEP